MKILHTSDWHIGRVLYGKKRYPEFAAFLDWLAETIEQRQVDVLLVAGDIFDNSTPSNRAQSLYYRFLCRIAASCCRHVVVIAGNHDSPTFINAPGELLRALDVHVIGSACETPEQEVLVLKDGQGQPELIVCAVPYLRDRDIRTVEAGETLVDKERKLLAGIQEHYAQVTSVARQIRDQQAKAVPVVGMGHLFTAGGETIDGDGVRELYVGSLAHVTAGIFPESLDYVALGHLHVPQKVGGREHIRYSGSPLPMGFGEARQQKSVCLVSAEADEVKVELLEVPVFQQLARVRGDWQTISQQIVQLVDSGEAVWLEVIYDGEEVLGDLRERLLALVEGSMLEILRVKNSRITQRVLGQAETLETLDSLDATDVFQRCLDAHQVPPEQRPALLQAYREILAAMQEEDRQAE